MGPNTSCSLLLLLIVVMAASTQGQVMIETNSDFGVYKILNPGQELELECKVLTRYNQSRLSNRQWMKDGSVLSTNEDMLVIPDTDNPDEWKLVIKNPQISDLGNYTCSGIYRSNTVQKTIALIAKPSITINMKDTKQGETLVLNCSVSSRYPKPEITWEINGEPISESNERVKLTDNKGVPKGMLTIENTVATDEGRYSCIAHNLANNTSGVQDVKFTSTSWTKGLRNWFSKAWESTKNRFG